MEQLQMDFSFLSHFKVRHELPSERALAATAGRLDERLYLRSPVAAPVIVSWQDGRGQTKCSEARALNMSSAGALVRAPERIPVGSPVYMESKQMRLMANAVVRHCTERKSKFLIGLEFRGSLVRSI
jgi:hypothetical protein